MNFNVYLDEPTGRELEKLSKRRKVPRNTLIREAVRGLVEKSEHWSPEVLSWTGDPNFPPFESHRADLPPADEDPLV